MMRARLIALALALIGAAPQPRAAGHVRYVVRCVEEQKQTRRVVYQATIGGPAGTDFTIRVRDRGYELDATFVNELAESGIDMRTRLVSRRRAGTSRNGLPLWEEDTQQHRFSVGFDQQVEMLPFGGAGTAGLLKIEILPARAAAASDNIDIHLDLQPKNGALAVEAYRVPHWYRAQVEIAGPGRIANANARLFVDQPTAMPLPGIGAVTVTASTESHTDPWKVAAMAVDGRWNDGRTLIANAHAATSGEWMTYAVAAPDGKSKWTLRVRVAPEPISASRLQKED